VDSRGGFTSKLQIIYTPSLQRVFHTCIVVLNGVTRVSVKQSQIVSSLPPIQCLHIQCPHTCHEISQPLPPLVPRHGDTLVEVFVLRPVTGLTPRRCLSRPFSLVMSVPVVARLAKRCSEEKYGYMKSTVFGLSTSTIGSTISTACI